MPILLFFELYQLSGTHYRKLFSVVTLLQFSYHGNKQTDKPTPVIT